MLESTQCYTIRQKVRQFYPFIEHFCLKNHKFNFGSSIGRMDGGLLFMKLSSSEIFSWVLFFWTNRGFHAFVIPFKGPISILWPFQSLKLSRFYISICKYSIAIWKTRKIWQNSNYLTFKFFKYCLYSNSNNSNI